MSPKFNFSVKYLLKLTDYPRSDRKSDLGLDIFLARKLLDNFKSGAKKSIESAYKLYRILILNNYWMRLSMIS